jgi:hypothetical protein
MSNSTPDYVEQLTACTESALKLCRHAWDLARWFEADEPDWATVAAAMEPIGEATLWLTDHWGALDMFNGLRPDAVVIGGVGHLSWHAAVAKSLAWDGRHLVLGVWGGTAEDGEGRNWVLGPWLDWTRADLGVEVAGDRGYADRLTVWDRIRKLASKLPAELCAKVDAFPPQTPDEIREAVMFSGWWHFGEFDAWQHLCHLRAEYHFARRMLSVCPPLPTDADPEGASRGRRPEPLTPVARTTLGLKRANPDLGPKALLPGVRQVHPRTTLEDIRKILDALRQRERRKRAG